MACPQLQVPPSTPLSWQLLRPCAKLQSAGDLHSTDASPLFLP